MGLACASCSSPPASENVLGSNSNEAQALASYDPPKLWGTPEYAARRAHDLAICRALGVEAGRLRVDVQDDFYFDQLPYVQAHQPAWVERPVAAFRTLIADWMYQENRANQYPLAALSTREAAQRMTDDRIRDGEVRVQQARVHFRDMGDVVVTRMALARWRHSPTRLRPHPDIGWYYYNLLSRGAPVWSEEAARFWPTPYWIIVVDGDAYLVRGYNISGRLEEPRLETQPEPARFVPAQICAFRAARTYDACARRPAGDPCLPLTGPPA